MFSGNIWIILSTAEFYSSWRSCCETGKVVLYYIALFLFVRFPMRCYCSNISFMLLFFFFSFFFSFCDQHLRSTRSTRRSTSTSGQSLTIRTTLQSPTLHLQRPPSNSSSRLVERPSAPKSKFFISLSWKFSVRSLTSKGHFQNPSTNEADRSKCQ